MTKADLDTARKSLLMGLTRLRQVQDEKRGSRSLSVAITQIETGLLWLNQAQEEIK